MTDETIGKGKGAVSLPASAFASTVTLPGTLQPYYVSPASSIPPVPALPSDLVGLAPNPNAPRRKLTKKRKSHSAQNSVDLTHNPLPSSSISRDNSNSSSLPPSTWKEFGVMDRSNSGSSSGSVSKLRKKRGGSIGNLKESISTEEKIIPEPPSNSMPSTPNGTLNGTFDGERKRKHRSKLSSIDTTNGSFAECKSLLSVYRGRRSNCLNDSLPKLLNSEDATALCTRLHRTSRLLRERDPTS
ncbi:hypothetical protein FRC02_011778 [Tulasnella sp. 418]|nr:hypothetical protein FRC02_011778 [Tulasnella sp. 418]